MLESDGEDSDEDMEKSSDDLQEYEEEDGKAAANDVMKDPDVSQLEDSGECLCLHLLNKNI